MDELLGKTVIVTGAGSGIGQALALGFVNRGAHVFAIGRSKPGLEQTQQRCTGPGELECHLMDVTDAAALETLFGQIVRQRGGIDVLINNAAVYPKIEMRMMPPEEWADGVATNLNGVAYACRAAIRTFPENRPALIFNVGSFAYLGPQPGSTLYCATKAALAAFTRALAVELTAAGSCIVVNEWVPGIYHTRMSDYTGDDPAMAFDYLLSVVRLAEQGPGGRTFERGEEVRPPRSLRSRLKACLMGRHA